MPVNPFSICTLVVPFLFRECLLLSPPSLSLRVLQSSCYIPLKAPAARSLPEWRGGANCGFCLHPSLER
jgi:hypothetical protein